MLYCPQRVMKRRTALVAVASIFVGVLLPSSTLEASGGEPNAKSWTCFRPFLAEPLMMSHSGKAASDTTPHPPGEAVQA